MKLFSCQYCQQPLLFENTICERCGHQLGYLPERSTLSAVEADGSNWIALADRGESYRFCANWEREGCNWLVRTKEDEQFCRACRHNRTIPDISDPAQHLRWQKIETAKRRLIYTLINIGVPLPTSASGDPEPLVFDFLSDPRDPSIGRKVMTGHDNGVITLSLAEADDAARETLRVSMKEPYRTLLGHFRHEVGHYYWDKLVRDGGEIDSCREAFGDESEDYETALKKYYERGAPAGWRESFISAYATSHPWEDFAETFAHFLHMIDTLETARAFGLSLKPKLGDAVMLAGVDFDPHDVQDIDHLINEWLPLTFAVNNINRSMGQPDLYPFVLSPMVIEKLKYVSRLVHRRSTAVGDAPAQFEGREVRDAV
ncbi:zinc-binding metallopeptidase family protein [Methylocapsa palsarum]|uniref:Zinc-ribbon domain-containing protein n=1 Tax=Methylocapsa palsarum TaxID=1612308 RepID=A0A1I4AQH2_9HYPH|nr:putative zinc-binding peptidase [Methylocapsa palsarum]SFK57979.1 hypothetical protein SAMN05444581_11113 [Methylocapsa palsarum]